MPGVYELADARKEVIYIGQSAVDVPERLRQHLARAGSIAQHARYWRWRYSRVPQAEEAELLATFLRAHGRLPACNAATPRERDTYRRFVERSTGR